MSQDFRATICEENDRAQSWLEVFGTREIPLKSPLPTIASAPGIPEGLFYELDLQELTQEQRTRLITYIAKRFDVSEQEVSETLDTVGCPILSENITITVFNPQKWL